MINVPYAIPVNPKFLPSIVIDNLNFQNVEFLVYVSGSTIFLPLATRSTSNRGPWARDTPPSKTLAPTSMALLIPPPTSLPHSLMTPASSTRGPSRSMKIYQLATSSSLPQMMFPITGQATRRTPSTPFYPRTWARRSSSLPASTW
jgi:hypothetical protein